MYDQVFIKPVPIEDFYDFLNTISVLDDKHTYYTIDLNIYKRIKNNMDLDAFLSYMDEYYHISKKMYVRRKMSYVKFITILRQICKKNDMRFETIMMYDRSKYNMIYRIYIYDSSL